MSLDVYLETGACEHCGRDADTLYHANITHNLGEMAEAANLYRPLWHPEEVGITTAAQLVQPLRDGLNWLETNQKTAEAFNPENGWGNYEGLVSFVRHYLDACEKHPTATVRALR